MAMPRFFKIIAIVVLFLMFLQYLYLFPVKLNLSFNNHLSPFSELDYEKSLFNFKKSVFNQKRSPGMWADEESSTSANSKVNFSKLSIVSIIVPEKYNSSVAATATRTTPATRISLSSNKSFNPIIESKSQNNNNSNSFSLPTSPSPTSLPMCPEMSPYLLGDLKVSMMQPPSLADIGRIHSDIALGGLYKPPNCTSKDKVAIILPFRDREEHLRIFLFNILPILKRQQIEFDIFVIEQGGASADEPFNRAMLFNVGFAEANKRGKFDCFIFHDVDLIPENDYNLYNCPVQPRHMSVAVDKMQYKLPYKTLFGGIGVLTKEHFLKVNGFSNSFWGWGGEDDDMAGRIAYNGLYISRPPPNIARYKMIKHKHQKLNNQRYRVLHKGKTRYKTDGINSLKYNVEQFVLEKTHTLLRVQLQK